MSEAVDMAALAFSSGACPHYDISCLFTMLDAVLIGKNRFSRLKLEAVSNFKNRTGFRLITSLNEISDLKNIVS